MSAQEGCIYEKKELNSSEWFDERDPIKIYTNYCISCG